jgi:hypothetical protein
MVLVRLEHATDREATVEVAIWPDQANIGWLDEDEQMSEDYAGADEEWTSAVADLVASVLRGDYAVEETYWLGRWIRTRIVELRPGSKPRQRSISVNWPWWLLIRPPGADVSRGDWTLAFGLDRRRRALAGALSDDRCCGL